MDPDYEELADYAEAGFESLDDLAGLDDGFLGAEISEVSCHNCGEFSEDCSCDNPSF